MLRPTQRYRVNVFGSLPVMRQIIIEVAGIERKTGVWIWSFLQAKTFKSIVKSDDCSRWAERGGVI